MKLYFPEITFSAAHYIPEHPICGGCHGHTYFVRDLTIDISNIPLDDIGMSFDFGVIKSYFKEEWDHKFLIPVQDWEIWQQILKSYPTLLTGRGVKVVKYTTAEGMAIQIQSDLSLTLTKGAYDLKIHFKLFEGPHQAIEV